MPKSKSLSKTAPLTTFFRTYNTRHMGLTLYFSGDEMSNPYQVPIIAENNPNQLNAVHEYSAAEISQLIMATA